MLGATAASWPAPSPARAQAEPVQPPVPTFPPAGDIAPPDWAIWNIWDQEGMFGPSLDCSAWYRASDYAGRWATGSTWWEYRCGVQWGAAGPYIDYFDYYHWDGESAVYYGTWGTESTADATRWGHNPECSYWYDVAAPGSTWTDHWFRPIACTTGIPAPPQLVRAPAEPLEWGGGYTIKGEIAATLYCVLTRSGESTPIYDRPCGGHGFWAVMAHGVGYASLADGTYTLSVTQTDLAGNTSAPATDTFTVDRLAGPAPPTFLTTPDESRAIRHPHGTSVASPGRRSIAR